VNPSNKPLQEAEHRRSQRETHYRYRTINERLVPFTTAGHLSGFMPFPRVGRKAPVRTEPLPTALSVALSLEQSFLSSSFSFSICSGVNRRAREALPPYNFASFA
jgi:hypothetical protein